ncbi:MAG TPA: hypothetical protein VHW24_27470 [Bryobacteraceae bacterium]|nr:hypothetical protein [Bryobacteraceae bacterium]
MPGSRNCRCTVCSIERYLKAQLDTPSSTTEYANLRNTVSLLNSFPTPSSLLAYISSLRHSNGSGEASDRIFQLLRQSLDESGDIVKSLLLLAFAPVLHATVTSIERTYPMLARDDISQQCILTLIRLASGNDWRTRETHLAYALARELRRTVFLWAKEETRSVAKSDIVFESEHFITEAELFERHVQLRHFLYRSLGTGVLNNEDLDLLIEFKLEGGPRDQEKGPASNAMRQRMKRLLSKMRRHARVLNKKS